MAELLRPLLDSVQISSYQLLELGRMMSPLALHMGLDVVVEVFVWVGLGTVVRSNRSSRSECWGTHSCTRSRAPDGGPQGKTLCPGPRALGGAENRETPQW